MCLGWPDISIYLYMVLKKQLWVKHSRLPGSGMGLFTKIVIPKGAAIVEYRGRISAWKELKNLPENGYLLYVNHRHVINALSYKKALARYANDARGLVRIRGIINNSEYITEGLKVYIKAMRDIRAGEEILVGSGKEYWDTVRKNQED